MQTTALILGLFIILVFVENQVKYNKLYSKGIKQIIEGQKELLDVCRAILDETKK